MSRFTVTIRGTLPASSPGKALRYFVEDIVTPEGQRQGDTEFHEVRVDPITGGPYYTLDPPGGLASMLADDRESDAFSEGLSAGESQAADDLADYAQKLRNLRAVLLLIDRKTRNVGLDIHHELGPTVRAEIDRARAAMKNDKALERLFNSLVLAEEPA